MIDTFTLAGLTLMLVAGQLLFKRVGTAVSGLPLNQGIGLLLRQPAFYSALLLYGIATLLWVWILSRVPISRAYPWVALSIVLVPALGAWMYGERLTPLFWLGMVCIVTGVILTQLSGQQ